MISSSLVSRVPPWNTTLRAPPERLVSSSDIHLKPTALDSGGAVTWGKSSFLTPGLAWPDAGLGPPDSTTATRRTTDTAPKSRPPMSRPPSFESRLGRRAPPRLDFEAGPPYHPPPLAPPPSLVRASPPP